MTDELDLVTLKNGALADRKTGRIVDNTNNRSKITKENSAEYRRLRQEKAKLAVKRAIIEGTQAKDVYGGIQTLSAAIVDLALTGPGYVRIQAYESLLKNTGLFDQEKSELATGVSISADSISDIRAIVEGLAKMRREE